MIPADLVELLRCPQSGQGLIVAGPEVLGPLNDRILPGPHGPTRVSNLAGAAVEQPLTEALVRQDQLVLYPIRNGIPVLLAEEAIRL